MKLYNDLAATMKKGFFFSYTVGPERDGKAHLLLNLPDRPRGAVAGRPGLAVELRPRKRVHVAGVGGGRPRRQGALYLSAPL